MHVADSGTNISGPISLADEAAVNQVLIDSIFSL